MARTVTIHDPATGDTFRATRIQWERIHEPAGRELVTDEDGNAPKIASKRKTIESTEPAAEQE